MVQRTPLALPPVEVTPGQLYSLIEQLYDMIHDQGERLDNATGEIAKLREEADRARIAQKAEIERVLEPWKAAKLLDKTLKYLAGLVLLLSSAGAVMYGMWKALTGWVDG